MGREELKTIAIKAKTIGMAIYGTSAITHFDNVQIDDDGDISVHFSYYSRGETKYETIHLTELDMANPIDDTVAKYKKVKQKRLKDKIEEIKSKEIILDCPYDFTSRCTMGRCNCKVKLT